MENMNRYMEGMMEHFPQINGTLSGEENHMAQLTSAKNICIVIVM